MEENSMTTEQKVISGKLVKKIQIKGKINALTGLHIGGTNLGLSIGGTDATIVRNPFNNEPYIPGSSLKGKMRSLLERVDGKLGPKLDNNVKTGPFHNIIDSDIPKIFGTTPENIKKTYKKDKSGKFREEDYSSQPVTRLIVYDCPLEKECARKLAVEPNTDMPFTEVKTEVVIDRITSAATPRQLERVPAGAEFEMEMVLNIYSGDDAKAMVEKVLEGLCLVENDYLGGKGTRGSGKVKFCVEAPLKYKDKDSYEKAEDWKEWKSETGQTIEVPTQLSKTEYEKEI